ncbi:MAG: cbb3-type cytochrome c oxidase N-terminal domain-containing protein [Planctomycetota bacterium]
MSVATDETKTQETTEHVASPEVAPSLDPGDGGTVPNDPLTGHAYDGITEFDNPMPGWWMAIFIATCIFGIAYGFVSLVMQEKWGTRNSYQVAVAEQMARDFAMMGELPNDNETILMIASTGSLVSRGEAIFAANCISCHGQDGMGGLVGPNLTDGVWKNVEKLEDIYDVIANGRNNNAMPAWQGRLSPNDLVLVSGYAASLKDKNVPGGKAPEGTFRPEW